MKTDTIRTVIEIVPDWHEWEWTFGTIQFDTSMADPDRVILDALAAAAVRVVKDKGFHVYTYPIGCSICSDPSMDMERELVKVTGPNETENRLEAIAEFVKGGFDG